MRSRFIESFLGQGGKKQKKVPQRPGQRQFQKVQPVQAVSKAITKQLTKSMIIHFQS
jgi:hypothetical protein